MHGLTGDRHEQGGRAIPMRRHLGQTGTALALALISALAAAQTKPAPPPSANAAQPSSASAPKSSSAKPQAAASPAPDQQPLQAQVDKLYQLAEDLKAAVAKSNKDTLSIDVIRKADAVEKAAKSLKDQMKSPPQTTDKY